MKTRWIGVFLVVIVAAGIVIYRREGSHKLVAEAAQNVSSSHPEIILVANLSEANDKADNCSKIIHLVRQAGKRGISVREFSPDSNSPLIKQYRVFTIPTLLVLGPHGKVVSRYEGESGSTVRQIRTRLTALDGARP